jgi:hypothetical protein
MVELWSTSRVDRDFDSDEQDRMFRLCGVYLLQVSVSIYLDGDLQPLFLAFKLLSFYTCIPLDSHNDGWCNISEETTLPGEVRMIHERY